jgi:hypothetical protein
MSVMAERSREPIRLLVFSASLRAGSLNTRRANVAAATIEANDREGGSGVDARVRYAVV